MLSPSLDYWLRAVRLRDLQNLLERVSFLSRLDPNGKCTACSQKHCKSARLVGSPLLGEVKVAEREPNMFKRRHKRSNQRKEDEKEASYKVSGPGPTSAAHDCEGFYIKDGTHQGRPKYRHASDNGFSVCQLQKGGAWTIGRNDETWLSSVDGSATDQALEVPPEGVWHALCRTMESSCPHMTIEKVPHYKWRFAVVIATDYDHPFMKLDSVSFGPENQLLRGTIADVCIDEEGFPIPRCTCQGCEHTKLGMHPNYICAIVESDDEEKLRACHESWRLRPSSTACVAINMHSVAAEGVIPSTTTEEHVVYLSARNRKLLRAALAAGGPLTLVKELRLDDGTVLRPDLTVHGTLGPRGTVRRHYWRQGHDRARQWWMTEPRHGRAQLAAVDVVCDYANLPGPSVGDVVEALDERSGDGRSLWRLAQILQVDVRSDRTLFLVKWDHGHFDRQESFWKSSEHIRQAMLYAENERFATREQLFPEGDGGAKWVVLRRGVSYAEVCNSVDGLWLNDFISHNWAEPSRDLIATLANAHVGACWICTLALVQHCIELSETDFTKLPFYQALEHLKKNPNGSEGRVTMAFDPRDSPSTDVLSRIWCIFEVWVSTQLTLKFRICSPDGVLGAHKGNELTDDTRFRIMRLQVDDAASTSQNDKSQIITWMYGDESSSKLDVEWQVQRQFLMGPPVALSKLLNKIEGGFFASVFLVLVIQSWLRLGFDVTDVPYLNCENSHHSVVWKLRNQLNYTVGNAALLYTMGSLLWYVMRVDRGFGGLRYIVRMAKLPRSKQGAFDFFFAALTILNIALFVLLIGMLTGLSFKDCSSDPGGSCQEKYIGRLCVDCFTAVLLPGTRLSNDSRSNPKFLIHYVMPIYVSFKILIWLVLFFLPPAFAEPYWRATPCFAYLFMLMTYMLDLHTVTNGSEYLMVILIWGGIWGWGLTRMWRVITWGIVRPMTKHEKGNRHFVLSCLLFMLLIPLGMLALFPLSIEYSRYCYDSKGPFDLNRFGLFVFSLPIGLVLWLSSSGIRRVKVRGLNHTYRDMIYDANSVVSQGAAFDPRRESTAQRRLIQP